MAETKGAHGLICLGASAGGLRSLEAVVSRLPADLPWPVFIAQHLQADRQSQMAEILQRVATLRVVDAEDGVMPEPGTIYACPSGSELGITPEGRISLRPPMAGKPQRIDHLFATAASARPGRVVAVVLSGTGTDGAVGALVVKLAGGTVIVESGASAQYLGMPDAAARAGAVDATLPADEIAALLVKLAGGLLDEASAATQAIVSDLADQLAGATGTDIVHYRSGTIRRRAEGRRAILGLPTLAAYRDRVVADPAERSALMRSLLIPVTSFFRDPAAWSALQEHVMPALAERAAAGHSVRIWCVGCASGEEAYSVAILVAESIPDRGGVEIIGTDLDPNAIATATMGLYDASRLEHVDPRRRARFFESTGQGFRVSGELREAVRFRVHDVTRDPAPGVFDLIICRNLLIYFDEELQERTLDLFYRSLTNAGWLFIGRSEAIPARVETFAPVARPQRIFQATARPGEPPGTADVVRVAPEGGRAKLSAADAEDAAAPMMIERSDAFVLSLDASWRIVMANGRAGELVGRHVVGERLLDTFPAWQGSPVHHALRDLAATGHGSKVRGVPTPWGLVDLRLEPVPGDARGVLLVGVPTEARTLARANVIAAREDLAATNDELQSTNEELAATNEELQAANEELASVNEEFQSTNQTLGSANAELEASALNARPAQDILTEIIQARPEAIVALGADRRVVMVNRRAAELFGIKPAAMGRPLVLDGVAPSELDARLDLAAEGPVERVQDHPDGKLASITRELRAPRGALLGWVLSWERVR